MTRYNSGMLETPQPLPPELYTTVPASDHAPLLEQLTTLRLENAALRAQNYEFALVSVAVALDLADGRVRDVRIPLGGVATKPWRAHGAEVALRGQPLDERSMAAAAAAAVEGATPRPDNAFKVELARRTLRGTLSMLGGLV